MSPKKQLINLRTVLRLYFSLLRVNRGNRLFSLRLAGFMLRGILAESAADRNNSFSITALSLLVLPEDRQRRKGRAGELLPSDTINAIAQFSSCYLLRCPQPICNTNCPRRALPSLYIHSPLRARTIKNCMVGETHEKRCRDKTRHREKSF